MSRLWHFLRSCRISESAAITKFSSSPRPGPLMILMTSLTRLIKNSCDCWNSIYKENNQMTLKNKKLASKYFHYFVVIFHLNNFNKLKLCTKFGWNWPRGPRVEDQNVLKVNKSDTKDADNVNRPWANLDQESSHKHETQVS